MKTIIVPFAIITVLSCNLSLAHKQPWEHWGPEYEALSAKEKQSLLWEEIIKNKTSTHIPSPQGVNEFVAESMEPTLKWIGDTFWSREHAEGEVEAGGPSRLKAAHGVGVIAKMRFEVIPNDLQLTGIFASGSDYGFLRFAPVTLKDPN